MTAVNIPCPHCGHVSRTQAERLPDKPVQFACPRCQKMVIADKKRLLRPDAQEDAAGLAAVNDQPLAAQYMAPSDRRFPDLPADAVLPSGIILGEDEDCMAKIREALRAVGSELELVSSSEAARELIINEQPELCIYVAGTIAAAPHPPMAPLTGLPPSFRRRLYLVLMADNVRTLDGNAAFVRQVNMTVAREDLPNLGAALHSGIDYHRRLYRPYFLAEESRGSL